MIPGIGKVERIFFEKSGEFFRAQFAINGKLCPEVECHASIPIEGKWNDEKLMDYLLVTSETMFKLYGDPRHPHPLDPSVLDQSFSYA